MGTAGRSAPLRRTGSLLGLLTLELAAVLALHWLGRFPGLRIGWDEPVHWLLQSPVQDVLGALLRTVGLVMAYWLLASTLLYLLASLTRLPSAVRAVSWATLPLVRRVADHAVAVTLATSMVGGSTLGVAGPALAADRRSAGPPARPPAAQASSTTAYGFDPAGPGSSTTTTTESSPTTSESTTTTTGPATTTTREPATTTTQPPTTTTREPTTTQPPTTTTTRPPTSTTTQPPTTTREPTTTRPPTTTTTERSTTSTTREPATTTTAYAFEAAGRGTSPSTTTGPASTAAPTTSTTGQRPPRYVFTTPSEAQAREAAGGDANHGGSNQGGSNQGGSNQGGGVPHGKEPSGTHRESPYQVRRGDNLWTIARDHLRRARSGGSGAPTNREVAEYWAKVVEANRHGLRSGDPDLIYPDEKITLPPVD